MQTHSFETSLSNKNSNRRCNLCSNLRFCWQTTSQSVENGPLKQPCETRPRPPSSTQFRIFNLRSRMSKKRLEEDHASGLDPSGIPEVETLSVRLGAALDSRSSRAPDRPRPGNSPDHLQPHWCTCGIRNSDCVQMQRKSERERARERARARERERERESTRARERTTTAREGRKVSEARVP